MLPDFKNVLEANTGSIFNALNEKDVGEILQIKSNCSRQEMLLNCRYIGTLNKSLRLLSCV
jgi:hypothetical protein